MSRCLFVPGTCQYSRLQSKLSLRYCQALVRISSIFCINMTCYGYGFEQIASLIGHHVSVTLKQQKTIEGFLYTIDPDTNNVVLYNIDDQKIRVILSHAILSLSINEHNKVNIDEGTTPLDSQFFSKEWIEWRRAALIDFLKQNHIPIEYGDKNKEQKDGNNINYSTNDGKENDQISDSVDDGGDNDDDEPVIHVLGCARVVSPYLATNVICDNPLIRKRVRDFILALPLTSLDHNAQNQRANSGVDEQ